MEGATTHGSDSLATGLQGLAKGPAGLAGPASLSFLTGEGKRGPEYPGDKAQDSTH